MSSKRTDRALGRDHRGRELGMSCKIARRDFLNGVALAVANADAAAYAYTDAAIDQAWRAVREITKG